jgi:putative MATE family efflux protein
MTEGSIGRKIFFFAVPLILGNLLQQLYNTADSVIVGNFVGSNALAAVGSTGSLIYMLIAFSQGAAVGAGVIISNFLGAADRASVQKAVHTAIAIVLILGVAFSIFGVLLSRPLLELMNTPDEVMEDSLLYLRIYLAGLIFNVLYNMTAGILNAAGNSRRSLIYLAIASVTNIGLDLICVAVLDMGVAGAAIATDVSQLISCVLSMRFLMCVDADYHVSIKELRIDRRMAKNIIKIGLPAGIQNTVISLSNTVVQSSVNAFGSAAMAGFAAYMKIDGFNILPVLSLSLAMTTFTGQNLGAGKLDRVKRGMWLTLGMGVVYTIATGALLLMFDKQIMRLFTDNAEAIAYGRLTMKYFCPFYFLLGIMHVLAGTVRGAGKSVPPMVIMLSSLCVTRILWIEIAAPLYGTIDGVYISYPITWAMGMVLMILYAWKGHWLRQDVKY